MVPISAMSVDTQSGERSGTVSDSVAGVASAARTGPQRCRRSNPAARHIRIPAREGADVGGWSAQSFARVTRCNVSPQLLPASHGLDSGRHIRSCSRHRELEKHREFLPFRLNKSEANSKGIVKQHIQVA